MERLSEKLMQYGAGPDYPCHMPGHKRRLCGDLPPEMFQIDVTEIDGFDNLHAPEGVIKSLQERISALYGAEESFCLVGGSTAGVLSAVSAAVPMGGHLLMARNCHKSAYHAAYLRGLSISYLYPKIRMREGIADGISPAQVKEALEREPDAQAVLLVSPTYEGVMSPIREIAEIVHAKGKILIVDEAHGAHLGISGLFPENSCQAGADLVIHSIHKTLPAMTQTALLHVNGERVDRDRLRRFLRIYQSSSPSYVLMASIDNCISLMETEGVSLLEQFASRFEELTRDLKKLQHIEIFCQDIGKLLLYPDPALMTGRELYDLLRKKYHLQLEMAAEQFCLAMFTVGDTQEGYRRMREALEDVDAWLEERGSGGEAEGIKGNASGGEACNIKENNFDGDICDNNLAGNVSGRKMKAVALTNIEPKEPIPLREAWDLPVEEIPIEECTGRISGEFINLYPPGTPILVPGEVITEELLDEIRKYLRMGLNLQGL